MRTRILLVLSICAVALSAARAENWPQFRGAGGTGVSADAKLPIEWSTDKNVRWKVEIPGVAWSSPIIWGDKVFITTAITDKQAKPSAGGGRPGGGAPRPGGFRPGGGKAPDVNYRWEVLCLEKSTGKTLWKELAVERKPTIPIHRTNTYASETPVTDGERVYAYFGMVGVFCFDMNGKLLWKKELGSYPMMAGWGTGSSPVLDDSRLFVQCDNEEKSFVVALDKKTGEQVWKMDREEKSSWGTPVLWKNGKRTELVAGGRKVRSYDPATGKVLWELGGLGGGSRASPVADGDLLIVGAGGGRSRGGDDDTMSRGALFAVKAGASGDITLKEGAASNDGVAWTRSKAGPSMASPLLYKGQIYVVDQRGGMISAYDAKSGKDVYAKERIAGARGFTASPWAGDDKIFCLDDSGTTFVIQAGETFKLLGKNSIGEMCWSTPSASGGDLFLRGVDHLFCIKP